MAERQRRLPCSELPERGGEVTLDAGASRHAKVLRLQPNDAVTLIDGLGHEASAEVLALDRAGVRCVAQPPRRLPRPEPALSCVLGLPKGAKLEGVVRMYAELGVSALHLAQCARCVPRPADHGARMERLRRVALEACLQSGQPWAPQLQGLAPLPQVAARAPAEARKLVFWERAERPLDQALWPDAGDVWAVIGPEGGLEEEEVRALEAQDFQCVGLGAGILRVETASVVAASLLLDRLGRLRT